jgi:hypothetical protein
VPDYETDTPSETVLFHREEEDAGQKQTEMFMSPIPPFLIVADRGRLRSYQVDRSVQNATPRLVESLDFVEGRAQLRELVTDKMGAFPNGGTNGHGNSPSERMPLVEELSARTIRNVAGRMSAILQKHAPDRWGFAAPSQINGAILDELPDQWKVNLSTNLPLDLTRIPARELLHHFEE